MSARRTLLEPCVECGEIRKIGYNDRRYSGVCRSCASSKRFKHGRRRGLTISGWAPSFKGEECCRVCGSTDNLHLHHVIPRSKSRAARKDLRNGLPLCRSCHSRWHHHSLVITRDVFTDEEWAYISSVEIVGQDTVAWLDKHYPVHATVTYCPNGHPRTPEHWYISPGGHRRQCRACMREYKARRRAEVPA